LIDCPAVEDDPIFTNDISGFYFSYCIISPFLI